MSVVTYQSTFSKRDYELAAGDLPTIRSNTGQGQFWKKCTVILYWRIADYRAQPFDRVVNHEEPRARRSSWNRRSHGYIGISTLDLTGITKLRIRVPEPKDPVHYKDISVINLPTNGTTDWQQGIYQPSVQTQDNAI